MQLLMFWMHVNTLFFTGFHHRLSGRKPVTMDAQLARVARRADALCLTQWHPLFEDVLPPWLATFKTARGSNSRHCTQSIFKKDVAASRKSAGRSPELYP